VDVDEWQADCKMSFPWHLERQQEHYITIKTHRRPSSRLAILIVAQWNCIKAERHLLLRAS
jgi:hypothetical protein